MEYTDEQREYLNNAFTNGEDILYQSTNIRGDWIKETDTTLNFTRDYRVLSTSTTLPINNMGALDIYKFNDDYYYLENGVLLSSSSVSSSSAMSAIKGVITGIVTKDPDTQELQIVQTSELSPVAVSGSYDDLSSTPKIYDTTIQFKKNTDTHLGSFTVNDSENRIIDIPIPTKTSDIENDSNYLSEHQSLTPLTDRLDALEELTGGENGHTASIANLDSNKADKTDTVSTVSYDGTNKKITKTINGATTDVVSLDTLKSDMSLNNVTNVATESTITSESSNNITSGAVFTALAGKVNNVSWNSDNSEIQKTVDNTTTTIVSASTLKSAMSLDNVTNVATESTITENSEKNITSGAVFTALTGKVDTSIVGQKGGIATLDTEGKVPASQLPSYVDDVLEFTSNSAFPTEGETGKIYVDLTTNLTYRWSGSAYVEISQSLALGTTSATAFRGDYGNTAYTHATESKISSAVESGLYKIAGTAEGHIASLVAVTKDDITGLGIPAQDTTYNDATTSVAGLMSTDDKTKLDGISEGAEVNVQANWNESTTTSDAYILNKPTLGTASSKTTRTLTAVGHSSWADATTDAKYVPDMSFIAYWNGAYNSSNNSNLTYCKQGTIIGSSNIGSQSVSQATKDGGGNTITTTYTKIADTYKVISAATTVTPAVHTTYVVTTASIVLTLGYPTTATVPVKVDVFAVAACTVTYYTASAATASLSMAAGTRATFLQYNGWKYYVMYGAAWN